MRTRLGSSRAALGVSSLVVALGATAGAIARPLAAPPWVDHGRVVAGPVAVGDSALVVRLDGKQLKLEDVKATSGSIKWSASYAASSITPGVFLTPVAIDGVALDLATVGSASNPYVAPEGIKLSTGSSSWKDASVIVADTPTACGGDFCIDEVTPTGSYRLVVLNPRTGKQVRAIPGLLRAMMPGLYQTSNFTTATVSGLGSSGKVVWTKTFSSLFGGAAYNPNGGWDFVAEGALDVGSVSDEGDLMSEPSSVNLGDMRTIGIVSSSGKVAWRDPGMFDCMGSIMPTVPVICRFSGVAHFVHGRLSVAGVSLTLEGINAVNGHVVWWQKVTDVAQLAYGTALRIVDGRAFVVTVPGSSKPMVIDLKSGRVSRAPLHAVYWCQHLNVYSVPPIPQDPAHGQKQGGYEYGGCSETGSAVTSLPAEGSLSFGVLASGRFLWPSTAGLEAASIPAN